MKKNLRRGAVRGGARGDGGPGAGARRAAVDGARAGKEAFSEITGDEALTREFDVLEVSPRLGGTVV